MLCTTRACACAIQSSTLNISGSGAPENPFIIEQAEFTDLAALELAVAALEADMTAAQGDISSLLSDVSALETIAARFDLQSHQAVDMPATPSTSGTTELTVMTINVTARASNGYLVILGHVQYTKTTGADTFLSRLRVDGTIRAQDWDRPGVTTASAQHAVILGYTANDTPAVTVTIQRSSGTGTAAPTSTGSTGGRLSVGFVAT